MNSKTVISAKGISKSFGATQALNNMHIELQEGEVHGIVGENGAGKSTLINVMSGVYQPNSGQIILNDRQVSFKNPREAQISGIGVVHQELALCLDLSVAENIFMGQDRVDKFGLVHFSDLNKQAAKILEPFEAGIDPAQKADWLTVAQQQVVEIAKALSLNCKILILDEPTSSLTESEAEALFKIINELRARGISILYISHRMAEIFDLCDRVTILRDGQYIDTLNVADVEPQTVINKMVGRTISNYYPEKREEFGEVILEAQNFTRQGAFENMSFNLRKGEILGFSGLVGAGRTELARSVCKIDDAETGEAYLYGKKLNFTKYHDAIEEGVVYLPEDRKLLGLFLKLSVQANTSAAALKSLTGRVLIDKKAEYETARLFTEKLNIKLRSLTQLINELSGGNQQKAMVAKWLATTPRVIFLDEPTRGIDVGAKAEIYALLGELVNEGVGVIVISSELPEVIGLCDRVVVMYEGQYQGTVSGEDINEQKIMTLASGH